MAAERPAVLCRRDLAEIGEARRYCAKPIDDTTRSRNPLEWCADCRARLPIWPTGEQPAPAPECVEGDGEAAAHLHGSAMGLEPCCGQHADCAEAVA